MGACAVGAWLVRCMWLGMLANKMVYKTTLSNGFSAHFTTGMEAREF